MPETIRWSENGYAVREAALELCGEWSRVRVPIVARTEWDDLSAHSRNLLRKHGIER